MIESFKLSTGKQNAEKNAFAVIPFEAVLCCFIYNVTTFTNTPSLFFHQEGSRQAESNLKFLLVLKDPCYELSEAKPKDIPAMLPKILNTIRFIWVNSEFYKTRERLTGILKKVCKILL